MSLQLPADHLDLMRRIVRQHVDTVAHQPIIFGSRATGTARTYSDVDLGFLGEQPLEKATVVQLVDALEESDLPYKVDVVDFATAEDSFKRLALATYEEI